MNRQRTEAGKPLGERHHPSDGQADKTPDRSRAMDAVHEIVERRPSQGTASRARNHVGKAMEAIREVVNEEKE